MNSSSCITGFMFLVTLFFATAVTLICRWFGLGPLGSIVIGLGLCLPLTWLSAWSLAQIGGRASVSDDEERET